MRILLINNNKIEQLDNHDMSARSSEMETENGEISEIEPSSNSSAEMEEALCHILMIFDE